MKQAWRIPGQATAQLSFWQPEVLSEAPLSEFSQFVSSFDDLFAETGKWVEITSHSLMIAAMELQIKYNESHYEVRRNAFIQFTWLETQA